MLCASSIIAVLLVAGCGPDSDTDPSDDETSTSGQIQISCVDYDSPTQQCNTLEVIRAGSQGQIEYEATINVGQPTLDLNAVDTTVNDSGNLANLFDDMNNPQLNVVLDDQAKSALGMSAVSDGLQTLTKLHPDQCKLLRVRGLAIPICV